MDIEIYYSELRNVYNSLQDEKSKEVFVVRHMFYSTGNRSYFDRIQVGQRKKYDYKEIMLQDLPQLQNCVLFGMGQLGKQYCDYILMNGGDVFCFLDNNSDLWGESYANRSCVSPDKFFNEVHCNHPIVISVFPLFFKMQIYKDLRRRSITPCDIYCLDDNIVFEPSCDAKNQYFDKDIIHFGEDEVYINGGCFNFGTCIEFLKHCPNPKKIYAFECSEVQFEACENAINNCSFKNVEFFKKGLYDSTKTIYGSVGWNNQFVAKKSMDYKVEVTSIDETVDDKVTFITMDIEGSELAALRGAENTIKRDRPKLAISVYHKPDDLIEIPRYILSLVPEYRLYLRHYSNLHTETVLYAVI